MLPFLAGLILNLTLNRKRKDWRTRRDRTELRNRGFEVQMETMVESYVRYCADMELGMSARGATQPSPPPGASTSRPARYPRMEEVEDEDSPHATPMDDTPQQEVYKLTVVDVFGESLLLLKYFLRADLGCRDKHSRSKTNPCRWCRSGISS